MGCLEEDTELARASFRLFSLDQLKCEVNNKVVLSLEPTAVYCLGFVIREFQFVLGRLFVMHVAGIATLELFKMIDENEVTPSRYVKDFASDADPLWVERICLIEFDLIERLRSWTKRFVYLPGIASMNRIGSMAMIRT